ncbi:unnamed protein product [Rhizophagus irregularis]|nr:unnamed protein product [Rhizophagus irregularis]CAB5213794.1 unnamed protein product [Rhizophagus irregularis]
MYANNVSSGNGTSATDIDVGIGQTSVALRVLYEYFTSGGNYDYGEFDSTAKIDFAVLEGIVPSWPQLVTPLEIKPNIRDKEGTNYYHDAMGQLADRFSLILKFKK